MITRTLQSVAGLIPKTLPQALLVISLVMSSIVHSTYGQTPTWLTEGDQSDSLEDGAALRPAALGQRTDPVGTGTDIQKKEDDISSQLRVALLQEQAQQAKAPETKNSDTDESEVNLLKQIEVIIAQQKTASAELQDLQSHIESLKAELGSLEDGELESPPPYSLLEVDHLRDSIKALQTKAEALTSSIATARESVERARAIVSEKQQALRQSRERNPQANHRLAELEVQLADELLNLRRLELSIEQAKEEARKLELDLVEKKLELIGSRVVFTQELLDKQIAEIDARELQLRRRAEELKNELQLAERRWLAARQEADSIAKPTPELLERVEALKAHQQAIQQELSVVNQRLQRLPMIRTAWKRRYLVVAGRASLDERRQWLEETKTHLEQLSHERRSLELRLAEISTQLTTVTARLDAVAPGSDELRRWIQLRQTALTRQANAINSGLLAIDSTMIVLTRLQTQIEGERARTLRQWLADSWFWVKRVWNYELTSIDDTSLTVGKVVNGLLLLFFGFLLARWLSHALGRKLPTWGVDEAGASVIETLTFYTLIVLFALSALRYANVPLTAFTFLGGAIAIGVGFGSQNIVNNFISGLILLAERPIKVGDLIQIGTTYGNVHKIGARSTQIRTGENLDIIVPNSKFLENDVTNLTRRDDRLRTSITVGVAYGSPLETVVRLMEQAAAEPPEVLDRPKPMVWFTDFGDNALTFQVHFWIKARTVAQMRKIETDVRLCINRLFNEQGIVIAFPQRDLHIQSPRPIEFRLVDGDSPGNPQIRSAG